MCIPFTVSNSDWFKDTMETSLNMPQVNNKSNHWFLYGKLHFAEMG